MSEFTSITSTGRHQMYTPIDLPHPLGRRAVVVAVLSLFVAPLFPWALAMVFAARRQGTRDKRITAALVISCVAVVLWLVGLVLVFTGNHPLAS